jgi:hypothetical protein
MWRRRKSVIRFAEIVPRSDTAEQRAVLVNSAPETDGKGSAGYDDCETELDNAACN